MHIAICNTRRSIVNFVTRKWLWFDWIFAGIRTFTFVIVIFSINADPELWKDHFVLALGWITLSFLASYLFWNPRLIHHIYSVCIEISLIIILLILCFTIDITFFYFLSFYCLQLGFINHENTLWWSLSVLVISLIMIGLFQENISSNEYLTFSMNVLINFGFGYIFNRIINSHQQMKNLLEENRKQVQLIEEQNATLVQYAEQIEQMSIIEERNRMARELHDTVGHTFTSVIMGMDAVMYLMEIDPSKAKDKLDLLRDVMRNGLEEVRKNIHEIVEEVEEIPLSIQMNRLIKEFAIHTGTKTYLECQGREIEVSRQIRWTFIRCLQESLTNAKRHGRAMIILVTLHFSPQQITLQISDDGRGAESIIPGFGLTTMNERVTALNGEIQLKTGIGKGMTVICSIPIGGEKFGQTAATTSG